MCRLGLPGEEEVRSRQRAGAGSPRPLSHHIPAWHSCMAPQESTDFNSSLASVPVDLSRQEDGTYFTVGQLD